MKELEERTVRFLKIAERHNLCFKRSKCNFNIKEIPILEVVVGREQVQMEIDKVKVVKKQKTPTKIKEVESFLGFANFYRWFIKNFSHTTRLKKFKVWTDYENLKYFREPHKLNRRQMRQYLKLQNYDFILQHIPGKTNIKADVLSRKDHIDTTEDNKDIQILKDKMQTRRLITPEIKMI